MNSWINIPRDSDFGIHNIPFGIFSQNGGSKKVGAAIGSDVLDLAGVYEAGLLKDIGISKHTLENEFLNDFISEGKKITNKVRTRIQELLTDENSPLKDQPRLILKQSEVEMHLPVRIGDYTDFYSSIEHATNVGKMFRDPDNALLPNWKHIPVGYHGRASSIVLSGVDLHRPKGQTKPADGPPVFGESKRVDFELEMAFIVGKNTHLGEVIPIGEAEDHIFGMVLFNDWSARDIQKWEYVPLGPFLAKNFGSSISPWVVTMEALEPFRVSGPAQDPKPLPYLQQPNPSNFDIDLEVALTPEGGDEKVISRSNFKYMYWSMAQQLAHHTINGCNVNVGDMMASGTISGPTEDSYGSMLELAWAGSKPLDLGGGQERKFIMDHDTVTMRGFAGSSDKKVGFGEVKTTILPSL
jgi:fumarylacetoacetase